MSNLNLRNITNSFQDVRLASLASWRPAAGCRKLKRLPSFKTNL
jgi:hypothetical protein